MAYNFGQFLSSDYASESFSSEAKVVTTSFSSIEFNTFKGKGDVAMLKLDNKLIRNSSYFIHLQFAEKTSYTGSFGIYLYNSEDQVTTTVATAVPAAASYDFIITPSALNYTYVVIVNTGTTQFTQSDINMSATAIGMVPNLLRYMENVSNKLKALSIEGTAGQLFMLNGNQFRIGRNGIFEIEDDRIPITSLNIIPSNICNTNIPFYPYIINYKY